MNVDENFMREALKEAKRSVGSKDWPIGCVIVLNGRIIACSHNTVYSACNRLDHAELKALSGIQKVLSENKGKAILYTTYEPCPMCFGACILSRIGKVVAGVDLDQSGAMYLRDNLPKLFKQKKFQIEFTSGVLAKECREVFLKGEPTKELIREGKLLL